MTNKIRPHSISLWRHFFHREKTPEQLVTSMSEWQDKWKWGFVKINPPACYHVLDWGAKFEFFDDEFREPAMVRPALETLEDIDRLPLPDPAAGTFAGQWEVIRKLRARFGPGTPMIQTVFAPIEVAHRMMRGRHALLRMKNHDPGRLHHLLESITSVFRRFVEGCVDAGADGIFFATKWASSEWLSWQDYEEFGRRYEMSILEALHRRNALVVLHVCGERTYLANMLDYAVDAFSYDFFGKGAPAPERVAGESGKLVLGGIDPVGLERDLDRVVGSCRDLERIPNWVAAPSCVVPPAVTEPTIRRLKAELSKIIS
jgi:uroporphyrinogen decarboxylase